MRRIAPALGLSAVALVAGMVVVAASARALTSLETSLLGRWSRATSWPGDQVITAFDGRPAAPSALLGAVAGLVVVWLVAVALAARQRLPGAWGWVPRLAWVAPFALAPPLLSRDAFAYAAQGQLVGRGVDPYRHSVSSLGAHSSALQVVDPVWRHSLTPYGPLGIQVEHVASWAGGGREVLVLVALRVLALAALVVTFVLLRRYVPALGDDLRFWLLFNPLIVLHAIGGMHLEALMCPMLLAAVLLLQRQRAALAGLAAGAALDTKATAVVFLLGMVVYAATQLGRRLLLQLVGGAAAAIAANVLLLPRDPYGWVSALVDTAQTRTMSAPSTTAYLVITRLTDVVGISNPPHLLTALRAAAVVGGVLAAALVLRRPGRHALPWLVGASALALLLAAPVLWPWYLAPSAVVLLAAPSGLLRPILLGAVPALLAVPLTYDGTLRLTAAADLVAVTAWLVWHVRRPVPAAGLG